MSAATFKPELKKPARQDGTCAVRIRITKFRQHAYWNLGKYILPGELNKSPKRRLKNWVLKNDLAPQINNAISNALIGLEDAADKNPSYTAAQIKEAYQRNLNPEAEAAGQFRNFFAFAEEYITRLKDRNYKTGFDMGYRLPEFREIAGAKSPAAEVFSARTLHKYVQHLKAKGNAPQTIKNKLRDIRTLYNAGVKENQIPDLGTPFADVKVTVPKKKRDRPNADQIIAFLNYEPENKLQEMAKTVTMLQYLLLGARVGEALDLKWEDVHKDYITYLPQKHAVKPKFVPRGARINAILEAQAKGTRFILPYLGEDYPALPEEKKHNRKKRIITEVNKGLAEIAGKLKLKIKLTSHMFRHAFADALIAAGASPHQAAAMIGHSNPKTTEVYFKELVLEDINPIANKILDKLEGKQEGEQ